MSDYIGPGTRVFLLGMLALLALLVWSLPEYPEAVALSRVRPAQPSPEPSGAVSDE